MSAPMDLPNLSPRLNGVKPWRDRLMQWLERVYANPTLYRWSLQTPLTRWVTKRRTQKIFDLMAGFVYSQVLLGCVRLDLFRMLQNAPADCQHIAQRVGVPAETLERLLLSAVALDLLEHRSQGRFGLGPLGVPMALHPGIGAMAEHNHLLYRDMQNPIGFLNDAWQGQMADYWPYAHDEQAAQRAAPEKFSAYSDLMASSQGFVVQEILNTYPFNEHQCVLDVGAGKARFASELAIHAPHLTLKLFDLPPVLALAEANLRAKNLLSRATLYPGSFLHDPLPTGADLVTLVRVAHDHPDDVVQTLLAKIHAALPVNGRLLLAEPMAQTLGDSRSGAQQTDAYFHFYLLAMGAGRLRTPDELMRLMRAAGFSDVTRLNNQLPIHAQLLVGRKT